MDSYDHATTSALVIAVILVGIAAILLRGKLLVRFRGSFIHAEGKAQSRSKISEVKAGRDAQALIQAGGGEKEITGVEGGRDAQAHITET